MNLCASTSELISLQKSLHQRINGQRQIRNTSDLYSNRSTGHPYRTTTAQITMSWEKPSNRRRNQVPQLGQQSKQSIPPLKVLSEKDVATAQFVLESGLTKAQLLEEAPIEVHTGANKKPFMLGEPLMWEELIPKLPTRMCELHAWYMKASASKDVVFRARIQDRHFHRGWMTYGLNLKIFMICTIKTP